MMKNLNNFRNAFCIENSPALSLYALAVQMSEKGENRARRPRSRVEICIIQKLQQSVADILQVPLFQARLVPFSKK